ncbi:MAG: hypothetical protein HBSAPP03_18540 [Phycisphaerae bacterium]|nr:MAG: hypothetical protein HBSAPP03_18540 [Phycisphaerae bacterium]
MTTVVQQLAADVARIKRGLSELLTRHSRISPREESEYFIVISAHGNNEWHELSVEGRRVQAAVKADYDHYSALVLVLIRRLTTDTLQQYEAAESTLRAFIEQSHSTWCDTPAQALAKAVETLDSIQSLLERLHSAEGEAIVVPDTNALLAAPYLDRWQFAGLDHITVVLVPTILAELDELKISHRNPDVRDKAKAVIGRIKEFLRRGDSHSGVPIMTGKITLRTVATEPRMADSLPWFDAMNNDDRFLASVIEQMRLNVRSNVQIVTEDINLLNKATTARISVLEPPGT